MPHTLSLTHTHKIASLINFCSICILPFHRLLRPLHVLHKNVPHFEQLYVFNSCLSRFICIYCAFYSASDNSMSVPNDTTLNKATLKVFKDWLFTSLNSSSFEEITFVSTNSFQANSRQISNMRDNL